MSTVERRFTPTPVELRARGELRIGGYAAKFGKMSKNLGGFVERLDPAVFNASRGDGWPGVIARYNHDDNYLLGTTGGGTLRLRTDEVGLDYEIDLPDTSAGRDLHVLIGRNDVSQSSFAFRTIEDEWGLNDQNFPLRTLTNVQLVDVAPVNVPAYADTTSGLRSLAEHMHADPDEVRKLADDGELRRLFVRTDNKGQPKAPATFGAAARMSLLARR